MENPVILSRKNYHRAATIRQIDHPELGAWTFEWRKQNLSRTTYLHHVRCEGDEFTKPLVDSTEELGRWEVLSWKYEVSLEDLWDAASNAFYATSLSPEERGAQYIREYEKELNNDLARMLDNEKEHYISKYKEWIRTLFAKHSRIMSPIVTGPARFPSQKNAEMNGYYDSAFKGFQEWREKYLKGAVLRFEEAKPAEQKESENWKRLKHSIRSCACTIKQINDGTNRVSTKSLFVSSIYGKVETYAKHGDVEIVKNAIAYVRELNKQTSVITERHKFFKLIEIAESARKERGERDDCENVEITFEGGKVVKNFSIDRLQIFHDKKPSKEIISKISGTGFNWSGINGCWQRKLTSNAYHACSCVVPVTVEQLRD